MLQNHAEDRARLKRVLPERAIALAMQNRWSEAADINRKIIELYPTDADAYSRLGKALMEMGRYRDALATYQKAIELDPSNIIAKKNIERLVHLADKAPAQVRPAPRKEGAAAGRDGETIKSNIFIEETGKTGLTALMDLGEREVRLDITPGDRLELRVNGSALEVYDENGEYVGKVEPKLAKRLIELMQGGNRYTAAATTVSENAISIIMRETYQHPSQRGKFSFPPRALPASTYRPYMREGALRYGLEDEDEESLDYDADESDRDLDESESDDEEVGFEEEDDSDEDES